jgi:hypothetical protein
MLIVSSPSSRNKPTGFREAYRVRSTTCDTKQHSKRTLYSDIPVNCSSGILLSQESQNTFLTPTKSAPMETHRDSRLPISVSKKCDIRLVNRGFSIPQTQQDPFQHCSLCRLLWNAWSRTYTPTTMSCMNANLTRTTDHECQTRTRKETRSLCRTIVS